MPYKYNTKEEKLQPIEHVCEWFRFKSTVDLRNGVEITPIVHYSEGIEVDRLMADVATFTAWWMLWIYPEINGFSGIDTVKWKLDPNIKIIHQ